MNHTVYMVGGSIYCPYTGCLIERPAILVAKEADTLHGYGDFENVEAKFKKFITGYSQAGMKKEVDDLMLIELFNYQIDREMACYVIRRASEYTLTGFIKNLCEQLTKGNNPIAWLKTEMERVPIDCSEKEWR